MAKTDYYEILGVKREATADEIKSAYRKLARQYHPDLHPGDKTAEAKFKEVQAAYDVLGDSDKRDQYDRFGSASFEPGGEGSRSYHYSWSNQGRGGPEAEYESAGGFDDILSSLFGGRAYAGGQAGGRKGSAGFDFQDFPGQDAETELTVPFRTAVLGGELEVTISGGSNSHLTITIPPGVSDGARLRLAGKGHPSPSGGKPGDLYVLVRVQPHPQFTRNGSDLYVDVPITIAEAVLGGSVDVNTLDGTATVTVPPGSSSGQKLRLRGKGGGKKGGLRGDLYAQLKIVAPKSVDEESKRLIEEFARRNPQNPRQS